MRTCDTRSEPEGGREAAPAGSSFAMRLLIRRCHSSSLHLLNEQREGEGRRGAGEREGVSGQISFSPSLTRMHSVRVRPSRASERASRTRHGKWRARAAEARSRFQPSRRGLGDMTRQMQRYRESERPLDKLQIIISSFWRCSSQQGHYDNTAVFLGRGNFTA